MSEEMEQDLLDAFRQHRTPEAGRVQGNWETLETSIAAGATAPMAAAAAAGISQTSRLIAGLLGGASVAVLAWALWPADNEPEATAAPVVAVEPAANTATPKPAALVEAAAVDSQDDVDTAAEAEPVPVAKPKVIKTRAAVPKAEFTMADEVRLIARTKAELGSGDYSAALKSTKEHAKDFPSGRLVDERKLLHVRALCGSGEQAQARKQAKRFLDRKPNSALSDQMRKACAQ